MLDVAVAYSRYKFLGNEFLTWLWFLIETDQTRLRRYDADLLSLYVGSRMVLENASSSNKETITIKGDDANMAEGRLALTKGAVVTEMHLSYKSGAQHWQFSVKGESLNISNLKLPEIGPLETRDDLEGVVLEKAYLAEKIIVSLNTLFSHFIKLRVSTDWESEIVPQVRKWAAASH